MNFEASRAKALDKLNYFVENNLSEYSKLRNFDFGPENRSNVSCLSPYITHGIINEKEVIKKSLSNYINFEDFDIITSCETVSKPKPSSEVYEYVLSQLKLNSEQTIAIEDTKVNQKAAIGSGIVCYLYPGEYSNFDYDDINNSKFISDGEMMPKLLLG